MNFPHVGQLLNPFDGFFRARRFSRALRLFGLSR